VVTASPQAGISPSAASIAHAMILERVDGGNDKIEMSCCSSSSESSTRRSVTVIHGSLETDESTSADTCSSSAIDDGGYDKIEASSSCSSIATAIAGSNAEVIAVPNADADAVASGNEGIDRVEAFNGSMGFVTANKGVDASVNARADGNASNAIGSNGGCNKVNKSKGASSCTSTSCTRSSSLSLNDVVDADASASASSATSNFIASSATSKYNACTISVCSTAGHFKYNRREFKCNESNYQYSGKDCDRLFLDDSSCSSAQVLVADDVSMNRKMTKRCLEKLGLHCDEAVDGAEAVTMCAAKRYRLVRKVHDAAF